MSRIVLPTWLLFTAMASNATTMATNDDSTDVSSDSYTIFLTNGSASTASTSKTSTTTTTTTSTKTTTDHDKHDNY